MFDAALAAASGCEPVQTILVVNPQNADQLRARIDRIREWAATGREAR